MQDIVPILLQLLKYRYRPKFGIFHQQSSNSSRKKTVDIRQESQLGAGGAVFANMRCPTPGNWNRMFPISQTDHQQLMTKSYFCFIHNQTHLLKRMGLLFKSASCNWFIPRPHVYRRIVQKTAQTTGMSQQLHFVWCFASDVAETHRVKAMNSDHQSDKIANLCNSFSWLQFTNLIKSVMLELALVYSISKMCPQNLF